MYKVLKPFAYSPDGIKVLNLKEGEEVSIKEASAPNLIKRKLIKAVKGKIEAKAPKIEAPAPKIEKKVVEVEADKGLKDLFKKKKKG